MTVCSSETPTANRALITSQILTMFQLLTAPQVQPTQAHRFMVQLASNDVDFECQLTSKRLTYCVRPTWTRRSASALHRTFGRLANSRSLDRRGLRLLLITHAGWKPRLTFHYICRKNSNAFLLPPELTVVDESKFRRPILKSRRLTSQFLRSSLKQDAPRGNQIDFVPWYSLVQHKLLLWMGLAGT